ncbi:aromatic-L-amino-acid decarboxylase [Aedes aegypti]|uniref:Tyrosine decarboxylase n=1 Tax=Aedes aegypti TaxID=7159 RepID=A0A1S4G848_AEDAE|nr:aromatic-L-amino-acid decarboxylase [Aedes aegypti]XP_021695640.1 aromatic-L-amino-acid decarboxylase [Aedes aegypti]XP_021695642.1 aromatic-L-amino-acid decarboxylase [Aedes aegypti]XP_021695643.1 aromatic-L-amino-acid decarboxylase [Aedes aegypti]
MDSREFRRRGTEMVEYICNYLETLEQRRVTPSVEPGYLRHLLPGEAPEEPEPWEKIMEDVESKIMPGVTHWQHPRFHAYFPSGNSFPSILGDMLSDGIGCIGFSWAASPACTELETIVLDWLGKAIGLPDHFLALKPGSKGGGVIQTSASECVLVTMLAARAQAIKYLKQQHPFVEEGHLLSKLMAYCSKEAHSCVEKAAMICFVKLRILEPDENCSLRADTLVKAMEEDEQQGLIPFYVSTTLGTTGSCAFDDINEIGEALQRFPSVWLHVDAAYAGNSFICPELKYLLKGIDYADSFNTNPNKWLLTNFDCSTLWVRDRIRLTSALVVDPLYLKHGYSDSAIDYRHWGVPLSRRFRSLKLWFVLRSYGITGLQNYIRHHIDLAKRFERLVLKDNRFEVCNDVKLGLVCFRLKGSDRINEKLLSSINASGKIHMVPASVNERYVIRFCATAQNAMVEDIDYAWDVITDFAAEILEKEQADEVTEIVDRRKTHTLAQKRSFFVRMVSDPKIYNPAINKAQTPRISTEVTSPSADGTVVTVQSPKTPGSASWISWPLAFLFTNSDDGPKNDMPLRFRHLDTMVRLSASRRNSATGGASSPSPEGENGIVLAKSPKRSPIMVRRRGTSPSNQPNAGNGSTK